MRRHLFLSLCVLIGTVNAFSDEPLPLTSDESLLIKRITEFWKDGDYGATKSLIKGFLNGHKESAVRDHLYAMLGDIYFKEGAYLEAAVTYEKISTTPFIESTLQNRFYCFFELKEYQSVIELSEKYETITPSLPVNSRLLVAESHFRKLQMSSKQEDRVTLAEKTKPLYLALISEGEADYLLFPLAEIEKIIGENKAAADLYINLAKKHPEKAEALLMQAAQLQYLFDLDAAEQTLKTTCELKGDKMGVAAYQRMLLLFQGGKYDEIIKQRDALSSFLPEEKQKLLDYYIGRAHAALGHTEQTKNLLNIYLAKEQRETAQLKSALLTLMNYAQKEGDSEAFEGLLERFKTKFPKSRELPDVLFAHAHFCIQKGEGEKAAEVLQLILQNFPDHENRKAFIYDYGTVLLQNKKNAKAREIFLSFVAEFPEAKELPIAFAQIITCSLQELTDVAPEALQEKKDRLILDLERLIQSGLYVETKDEQHYKLLLAKSLYEREKFAEAAIAFNHYLECPIEKSEDRASANLLVGICALKSCQNHRLFVDHALLAFEQNKSYKSDEKIHLQLYNSYLALSKDRPKEESAALVDLGANHLFIAFEINPDTIKKENISWLSGYYMQKREEILAKERLERLYTYLLKSDNEDMVITSETLFLEGDAIAFAAYLKESGALKERAALLEQLKKTQDKNSALAWKNAPYVAFELAHCYEELGDAKKALSLYSDLITLSNLSPTYYTAAAELQRARLLFSQLVEGGHLEQSEKFTPILGVLKDLQIRKNLQTEPLHLEAALEYAEIRTRLSEPKYQVERALFFLRRIQEDYLSQDDLIAKEYLAARKNYPEKDRLYKNYMKYIDAEITRLEMLKEKAQMNLGKAELLESRALLLFNELIEEKEGMTPYLKKQAFEGLERINHS